MIDTFSFDFGNLTTFVGFFGVISSAVIVYFSFKKHFESPLNK